MPRTQLLEGMPPAVNDRDVLVALVRSATPVDGTSSPTPYRVGISNEHGAIYRIVTLYGLTEKALFTREMAALGYESDPLLGAGRSAAVDEVFALARRG